jgi:hypothetical protein
MWALLALVVRFWKVPSTLIAPVTSSNMTVASPVPGLMAGLGRSWAALIGTWTM